VHRAAPTIVNITDLSVPDRLDKFGAREEEQETKLEMVRLKG
jgi:hypothetical protein